MTMHGERTRASPPIRSADTEAANINIDAPRIPPGQRLLGIRELDRVSASGIKLIVVSWNLP
jgi:hypothetical protein